MNCDQVFQHLTSVRRAVVNGALSKHLDGCSSCRQLAELFEPAAQLLGSDIANVPTMTDEAGDRWSQVWESALVAERAAAQLEQLPRRRSHLTLVFRTTAVLFAGVMLGILWPRAGSLSNSSQSHTPIPAGDSRERHMAECRYENLLQEHMQSMPVELCADCRPKLAVELASAVSVCSVCHTRTAESRSLF